MSDDIHALIGAYALDAVNDDECAEFERHLQACGECRAELAGLREVTALLGASESATPPPALRDSVLGRITEVRPLPPVVADLSRRRTRRSSPWRWIAAAAAAAAIVVGGIAWHPWNTPEPVTAVQQVLQAPDAHRYTTQLKDATATVVFSPELGKSVLESNNMPAAPAGHTYQLWYLTAAGKATSAGLFTPQQDGSGRALLNGDADAAALVAITVEPAGGSPQPTTRPIMTVQLSA